jgi:serine/threonine protein kinase
LQRARKVRVVGDRYEILERIGDGGMADVFRAHDRTLDRDVALKVLRAAYVDDAEFAQRFHREADALAAVHHPNIVSVLDWGTSEDGPYIAMELMEGGTLRELLRSQGRLTEEAAARLAAEIADGLEAAHLRGVLHRDLKPDNVLLDGMGKPKLGDFGIARIAAATAITRTGELLGTPRYLAPEQMTGEVVDERADVYALGVILYEMLTGVQPTGGVTASEIVSRRLRSDPRPLRRIVRVTPALEAVVMRAVARDRSRRFARASDLRAALLSLSSVAPAATATRKAAPVSASRPRRRSPLMTGLATLATLIGASVAFGSSHPIAFAPAPAPSVSPMATGAVLAATSEPSPTPSVLVDATPEPVPIPTAAPTVEPAAAPAVDADPAETILAFYRSVSGHDYGTASGFWSDRMRARYPPQTNIWGRFDATAGIRARSAAVTSTTSQNAIVAVDLLETMRDGTVRRWVGTWYLVRSPSGWLMDQPGLRPG